MRVCKLSHRLQLCFQNSRLRGLGHSFGIVHLLTRHQQPGATITDISSHECQVEGISLKSSVKQNRNESSSQVPFQLRLTRTLVVVSMASGTGRGFMVCLGTTTKVKHAESKLKGRKGGQTDGTVPHQQHPSPSIITRGMQQAASPAPAKF